MAAPTAQFLSASVSIDFCTEPNFIYRMKAYRIDSTQGCPAHSD
ncbi:MAG: hypothetical protein ACP5E5_13750 [Acidobacteriaceae bacterium]